MTVDIPVRPRDIEYASRASGNRAGRKEQGRRETQESAKSVQDLCERHRKTPNAKARWSRASRRPVKRLVRNPLVFSLF